MTNEERLRKEWEERVAEGGDLHDEWLAFSKEQEHNCFWRAENDLCKVILKNPEILRFRSLMLEIADSGWPIIDYSEPFEKIYQKLLFAAKVLYKERKARGKCGNCGAI